MHNWRKKENGEEIEKRIQAIFRTRTDVISSRTCKLTRLVKLQGGKFDIICKKFQLALITWGLRQLEERILKKLTASSNLSALIFVNLS